MSTMSRDFAAQAPLVNMLHPERPPSLQLAACSQAPLAAAEARAAWAAAVSKDKVTLNKTIQPTQIAGRSGISFNCITVVPTAEAYI